jgi:hypothetical protein
MKIRIKTFNGELPSYLTVGKVYEVDCFYENNQKYPCIYADNKHHIVLEINKCWHLNGGSWEIVNE